MMRASDSKQGINKCWPNHGILINQVGVDYYRVKNRLWNDLVEHIIYKANET